MRNRVLWTVLFAAALVTTTPAFAQDYPTGSDVRFGFVVEGEHDGVDSLLTTFQQEIIDLLGHEWNAVFDPSHLRNGNWQETGIREQIAHLHADPTVDMVIVLGHAAAAIAWQLEEYPKPTFAVFVSDPRRGIPPLQGTGSGIHNLNYLTFPGAIRLATNVFRQIVPYEHLAMLVNGTSYPGQTEIGDFLRARGRDEGYDISFVPVGETAEETLQRIPADADAVMSIPMLSLPLSELGALAQGLIDRRLPACSALGQLEVERGFLCGIQGQGIFTRLARRTALNIQRILMGADAADVPVMLPVDINLTVNLGTARAMGQPIPYDVLYEANLTNPSRPPEELVLGFHETVREAVAANLGIRAQEHGVRAGSGNMREAWANLLPQLDLSAAGVQIDEDRASPMAQAERTVSTSATLSQVLYSDGAWGNVSIQRNLQRMREHELAAARLDIGMEAAEAYVNVLRIRANIRIQRENLKVVRSNLELARVRELSGAAGPSEVYRWEAEIARKRADLIEAVSREGMAEVQFNRVLSRPQESPVYVREIRLADLDIILQPAWLAENVMNPQQLRLLRTWLAEKAVERSPELAALDGAIAAQERAVKVAKRRYYAPTLAMIGVNLGLLAAGQAMGFMTFLGVISLAGIVINNAIVLLDRIRIEIEEHGREPRDAIVASCQRRARPILLTTTTTIGGMLPLWLFAGPMWESMAVAIIFGLLFASVLTLVVVPVLYSVFFRVK